MTFNPLYRGTRAELLAEEGKALRWFTAKVTEKMPPEMALKMGDADITHVIDRSWGGYHTPRKTDHEDFFHLFRMPQPGTTYGEKRFTIRKDGTINVNGAVECAINAIRRTEERRERQRIFTENEKVWAKTFTESPRTLGDRIGLIIQLSQTDISRMNVKLRDDHWQHHHPWEFSCTREISIHELGDFVKFAETTRDFLKENF